MTLITFFTAPKPFTNPHIAILQRNAIRSWQMLSPEIEVFVLGNEPGTAEAAAEMGFIHFPEVSCNPQGTPLVSSLFEIAHQNSRSPYLAYLNADILLLPDFVEVVRKAAAQADQFLIIGQRWDLDVRQPLDFSAGWEGRLQADVMQRGKLHAPAGSDYFVFPRTCFRQVPDFAIGRAGWDNWMIYQARREGWKAIDATADLMVIHQRHDYSHLPDGKPHYRLPESYENVRLAGGRRSIFHIEDADYCLKNGRLEKLPWKGPKLWRELEIFPLVRLHSNALGEGTFALFHPVKAWGEVRGRLAHKFKQVSGKKS